MVLGLSQDNCTECVLVVPLVTTSACLLLPLAAGVPREMKTPESSRPGVPGVGHPLTFFYSGQGKNTVLCSWL